MNQKAELMHNLRVETSNILSEKINDELNYKLNNKEYTAFIIDLKWVYEKDLNYDKLGQVICLQEDSHIYVVEYKALGENKEQDEKIFKKIKKS